MSLNFSLNSVALDKIINDLKVGKVVGGAVYLHKDSLKYGPGELCELVASIVEKIGLSEGDWNVLKVHRKPPKVSLLHYPGFFYESYPALAESFTVDLSKGVVSKTSYSGSKNPPILHRKELFVGISHPSYREFCEITEEGEKAGLYENPTRIGFKRQWEELIESKGLELINGRLVRKADESDIDRHKTALSRSDFSAPIKSLGKFGYLEGDYTLFDYGCGRGDDLRELAQAGITAHGWDPHFCPESEKIASDLVNLGFVINVIEERKERVAALRSAYQLANKLLVVSAMIGSDAIINRFQPFKDGVVTSRNTFQKYFSQGELRNFIEQSLGDTAIPVAPGIFFIFKDKDEEQLFDEKRHRRSARWETLAALPREKIDSFKALLDENREKVDQFWAICLKLGRVPMVDEMHPTSDLIDLIGTPLKIFRVLKEHFDTTAFEKAREERFEDLQIYFALSHFGNRKPYKHMPDSLQRDVKEFFANYKNARSEGLKLLSGIADVDALNRESKKGFDQIGCGILQEGKSFTFHRRFLDRLPKLIRVYVGCAEKLYGDVDDVDLIKVHIGSHKCSFMSYDDFDGNPIPGLKTRVKIKLAQQEIDFFDYSGEFKPSPLYHKSKLLGPRDDNLVLQQRFETRLVEVLEGEEPSTFYCLAECLKNRGYELKGNRFFRV